jgi:quinol monooxygenase YgiN
MIGLVATLKVQPDKTAEFETVFGELVAQVRVNEKGCRLYQLARTRKDPCVYKVLELYDDQAALDAHMKAEYFKGAAGKFGGLLAGAPDTDFFDAVG